MLLAHGNMRVSHVTTHVALQDVPKRLTPERLRLVLDLTHDALLRLGIAEPRIAVAALNPHAGEGGLFGREDIEVSEPTIAQAVRDGMRVSARCRRHRVREAARRPVRRGGRHVPRPGAHPGQAARLLRRPATGRWRRCRASTSPSGLPIIRTSVDHGTAFDIAGKGIASERSLIEAIEYAERLSAGRA
jgi:4-hydroxythreonine-4-phosphate dehydrogenase